MVRHGDGTGWLTTQSIANQSLPQISLLTGKNTGKFAKSKPSRRLHALVVSVSRRFCRISLRNQTGNFGTENREVVAQNREVHSIPEEPPPRANRDCEQVRPTNGKGPSLARRASVGVRFTPESDRLLRCREMSRWASRDQSALQQNGSLFDHLVGAGEEGFGESQTEPKKPFNGSWPAYFG
jgi:hypothetical protein